MVKYYIIIGIIYTIPYIVTIVISGLRKKLETDRNFYGKTIDIQKIELTNVSYKKFEIARNNIKKYTEMGEINMYMIVATILKMNVCYYLKKNIKNVSQTNL